MKSGIFDKVRAFFQVLISSDGPKRGASGARQGSSAAKAPNGKTSETQGQARRDVRFSDLQISGASAHGQPIPGRKNDAAQENGERAVFDKFIADMHTFADREESEASFVPLDGAAAGYDSLSAEQLKWYFRWRSEVRSGRYPDTSEAYIFIHAQEILNGCGWTEAQDGLDSLVRLWSNYRTEFPEIDRTFFGWSFDFAQQHRLDFSPELYADIHDAVPPAVRNMLIDRHRADKPLKLSMSLVEALSAYSVRESRFYKEGHCRLIEGAMPRVIALADAALLKKTGKGILQQYGPRVGKKQRYAMYSGAVHPMANRSVEVTVRAYVNTPSLQNYIGSLLRCAENVLRGMYKCRGRLRVENLDSEMASLIEAFLKREYAPEKGWGNAKPVGIQLDFDSIDALRLQSDAVREALEVAEEQEIVAPETEADAPPAADENDASDFKVSEASIFAEERLSAPMQQILGALEQVHHAALRIVLASESPLEQLGALAEEAMTMPEMLIDEINDAAVQVLDDILIDAFGDEPRVLEQYECELKNALIDGGNG